jgi:hypothetical protein
VGHRIEYLKVAVAQAALSQGRLVGAKMQVDETPCFGKGSDGFDESIIVLAVPVAIELERPLWLESLHNGRSALAVAGE